VGARSTIALAPKSSPPHSPTLSPHTGTAPAISAAEGRPWLATVVAFWLAGVGLLLTRFGAGWWWVHRLRRQALLEAPSHWGAATERLAGALDIRAAIRVVDSMAVDTPTVIGWLRPVIVLPIAAFANLTPAQVTRFSLTS
jgi:beta-lactamase regulating signal transducer with metallopeptidase domain